MKKYTMLCCSIALLLTCAAVRAESVQEVEVTDQSANAEMTTRGGCKNCVPVVCCPRTCPTIPTVPTCPCPVSLCPAGTSQIMICGRAPICAHECGGGATGSGPGWLSFQGGQVGSSDATDLMNVIFSSCVPCDAAITAIAEGTGNGDQTVDIVSRTVDSNGQLVIQFNFNSDLKGTASECPAFINFIVCGCTSEPLCRPVVCPLTPSPCPTTCEGSDTFPCPSGKVPPPGIACSLTPANPSCCAECPHPAAAK